jgi:Tfp pilus assembly protein PilF
VLAARGRFDEAIDCYHRVLAQRPDHAGAHKNLGVVLAKVGKYDDAIASFRRALELQSDYLQAQNGLAAALTESGRLEEAAELYRRVLELRPHDADATANLATVFSRQGQLEQAASILRKLLDQSPGFTRGHINLGAVLTSQQKFDEALGCFLRAVQIDPGNPDAHYSDAVTLLLLGRWQAGWAEYEWRWTRRQLVGVMPKPLWNGEAMPKGTLLVHAEQGLGDTLQFVRLARMAKQRVGTVVLECQPQLASLLAGSKDIGRVVARGEPLGEFDAYVPLLSLPHLLQIDEANIPRDVPYLFPSQQLVEKFREELAGQCGYKIGISWQGSPHNPSDRTRSFRLAEFSELVKLPGVQLYSLQFGTGREQVSGFETDTLVDLGDRLGDFDNTAAIVQNLDLVITCDSALAHLAGGLGVPVWVPLPLVPDWRWLQDREDSPWYPTMRLFRQSRRGDWSEPFARMREVLAKQV